LRPAVALRRALLKARDTTDETDAPLQTQRALDQPLGQPVTEVIENDLPPASAPFWWAGFRLIGI
jgi:CHAT domain-containing protein